MTGLFKTVGVERWSSARLQLLHWLPARQRGVAEGERERARKGESGWEGEGGGGGGGRQCSRWEIGNAH